MSNVEIVSMTADCIDDVMIIEKLSFSIPWSRDAFMEEILHNRCAVYFVCKIEGRIVGYAGFWKVLDEGHITNIAVHPEYRNCGVGSKLMEKLVESSAQNGITRMTLEVRKSNLAAQALYGKYGFIPEGIRRKYYADNQEDAIIMWRYST